MKASNQNNNLKISIKRMLLFFIISLIISGITAFPIQFGLELLVQIIHGLELNNSLFRWIIEVNNGIHSSYQNAPYIAYGTDWLAFAHIIIAFFFIGPYLNPIPNKWVLQVGMLACALVFPLAFIAGNFREIPFIWQLIDCSFGLFGFITLFYCYKKIEELENSIFKQNNNQ